MAKGNPDSAGVIAPPPLIFGVPLAVALYEDRSNPLPVMSPRFAMIVGGAIALVGLVLLVAAVIQLWRARTTLMPYRPTTAIVDSWPYSFTRNPIYLALAVIYIGTAVFFNSLWPLLLLPLVMLVMQRGVIEREERYLEGKFGSDYVDYRSRVGRWL
jgi:protein-S-isoprenylcysteine O-methyltransferase Ste14